MVHTSLEQMTKLLYLRALISADGSVILTCSEHGQVISEVRWNTTGQHSVANALGTIAAAQHVGVTIEQARTKPYPTLVVLNAVWSC